MKSSTTRRFRAAYAVLPDGVQRKARLAYQLFRENPFHPSLQFKKVDEPNIYLRYFGSVSARWPDLSILGPIHPRNAQAASTPKIIPKIDKRLGWLVVGCCTALEAILATSPPQSAQAWILQVNYYQFLGVK